MRYRITTPVAGFTGNSANVAFRDGVAEIDSDTQGRSLAFFRRHGYGVVELPEDGDDVEVVVEEVLAPPNGAPGANLDPDATLQASADAAAAAKAAAEREAAAVEMPRRSASKEAWRDYAVSQGMSAEDANAMTRDDLAAHYAKEGDR